MATQVLRPQDCLTHRIGVPPAVFPRRKTNFYGFRSGIPKVSRPVIRSERNDRRRSPDQRKRPPVKLRRSPEKKRSPEPIKFAKRSASAGDLTYKQNRISNNNNNLLGTGNVKILRRGESLESLDPGTVMKQVRVGLPDVYAGSAVTMSPSPRALPVPSFFKKGGGGEKFVDDSATKDLRRMLRLD